MGTAGTELMLLGGFAVRVGGVATDASHWRRTLAGALVTLGGTRLAIERAPARRAAAARAVWKLKKLAKSATQGRQDGKRN